MTFSCFITPEYVYRWSIVDDNIDPNLIQTFIIKAQDINIQTAIGNNLYVKLMNDIANNTLTGYYQTLVNDYIQKCQLEWTIYQALPYINYRLTNKAVSEKKSDSSDPTELKNIQYLREDVRNTAEFLTRRITEFIINNQAQFPEFFFLTPSQLQITPRINNYFGGIYLKQSPQRRRDWRRGGRGNDPIKPFDDECCR
jgi:hypothetical protein